MWHVLHLIVRPIEALIGLFCVLTAMLLYRGEEGKIQSKFEDFWIRVDDYKTLALSRHAAFMTQVVQLESRFFDWAFGEELISIQSVCVSCACSVVSILVTFVVISPGLSGMENALQFVFMLFFAFCGVFVIAYAALMLVGLFPEYKFFHGILRWVVIATATALFALGFTIILGGVGIAELGLTSTLILVLTGGLISDVVFVMTTRWLLRVAGGMKTFLNIGASVTLTILLAAALISPLIAATLYAHNQNILESRDESGLFLTRTWWIPSWRSSSVLFAFTNVFDALLAFVFALLATLLLVHRLLWPLLTRTLFKMADIGTKGRRAILTTIGLALLGTSVFGGKFPELVAKLIEKFGG